MGGMADTADVVHMGVMGLLVSVVAPAVVLIMVRRFAAAAPAGTVRAALALPGFALLHAAVTLRLDVRTARLTPLNGPLGMLLTAAILLAGAMWFWTPVLGRRRLADPGRTAYLFIAAPLLDLPAVWLVAQGHVVDGLAMIVGMLPLGVIAIAVTWRWIAAEERTAKVFDLNGRVAGDQEVSGGHQGSRA
jgi:hypothetical protein